MAGKKACMSPQEIAAAGYIVEMRVPIGAGADTKRRPWIVRWRGDGQPRGDRWTSYGEAVQALRDELAHPDSTWPKGTQS